jgi:hypothetical protein
MCHSTSFFSVSKSTAPSLNGVTNAGIEPLNITRFLSCLVSPGSAEDRDPTGRRPPIAK